MRPITIIVVFAVLGISCSSSTDTDETTPPAPEGRSVLSTAQKGLLAKRSTSARTVSLNEAGLVDMVIASVDGEPITTADLRRFLLAQGTRTLPDNPVELQQAARDLVISKLFEKEAEKLGISVGEDEVAAYIQEIQRQNNIDEATLRETLQERGLSFDDYKKQVVRDVLKSRVIGRQVRSKVNVVDEDIERYLNEHPQKAPSAGEVHLHQIALLPTGLFSSSNSRAQMEEYRTAIANGRKVQEVAPEYYSDLGFLRVSDLRPAFQEAVSKVKPGEVTEVVDVDGGLYLFIVSETNEGNGVTGEVREQVRRQLTQVRMKEELDRYLNDELPSKYDVELKL